MGSNETNSYQANEFWIEEFRRSSNNEFKMHTKKALTGKVMSLIQRNMGCTACGWFSRLLSVTMQGERWFSGRRFVKLVRKIVCRIVYLKVIGRRFATDTSGNVVKWDFSDCYSCFSQLRFSCFRANRFCFKDGILDFCLFVIPKHLSIIAGMKKARRRISAATCAAKESGKRYTASFGAQFMSMYGAKALMPKLFTHSRECGCVVMHPKGRKQE